VTDVGLLGKGGSEAGGTLQLSKKNIPTQIKQHKQNKTNQIVTQSIIINITN